MSKIFIVSGPSGAGKTTLIKRLFRKKFIKDNFLQAVSFTTRPKRRGEKEERDYFFVGKKEFLRLRKKKYFLEFQEVFGDLYATPKFFLEEANRVKRNLFLCIDVKGGKYLKNKFKKGKIVTIFVAAPSEKELCIRLGKRKETKNTIKKRVGLAKKELQYIEHYDYLVINYNIEESLKNIEAILRAEKLRANI